MVAYILGLGDQRERAISRHTEATVFYNLTSKVTSHYLLLDDRPWYIVGAETSQRCEYRAVGGYFAA